MNEVDLTKILNLLQIPALPQPTLPTVQQPRQQQYQQNCLKSPNGQPLFSLDRRKNTSGQDAAPRNTNVNTFITAREELHRQNMIKNGQNANQPSSDISLSSYGTSTKTLGYRRSVNSKFVPPVASPMNSETIGKSTNERICTNETDDKLKNIEPKMIELIQNEIMDRTAKVGKLKVSFLRFRGGN